MTETGKLLWTPSEAFVAGARLTHYRRWLAERHSLHFEDYQSLHRWSVSDLPLFWESIWDYFQVQSSTPRGPALTRAAMPGAIWFPQARVNYARRLLEPGIDTDVVVQHFSEARPPGELTWAELRREVRRLAQTLKRLGVEPGDRVAAYIPNVPEALIGLLAVTGIGALWSSCSPDFGVSSVLDRFVQIRPKVLIAVDGYRYGGRAFDRRAAVRELLEALPSVAHVLHLPYLHEQACDTGAGRAMSWAQATDPALDEQIAADGDPLASDFAFDHPLWIVYSSGTTGLPKGMVHGHGGILLEQHKLHALSMNHGPDSKLFFYTTTGWIMFNLLTSALINGTSIVMYDGNPAYPDLDTLWRIVDETDVTSFGTSPTFVNILAQNAVVPRERFELTALKGAICTGSPLTPESFSWFYHNVKADLWVSSTSGGTDIATAFVGGVPTLPVYSGELQGRCLGVDVQAFDEQGNSVIETEGELVVTQPMPSMPLYFWNDEDGSRYRESYFDKFPGVWRHGDLLRITRRGSAVIPGRSDATLNRHGVRIGTSEIYRTVEAMSEVTDSLVVHLDGTDDTSQLLLFVVLREGATLDEQLIERIRSQIKGQRSPRHVPDQIMAVPMVPYTLTGKKMEVPVKRLLMGAEPGDVVNTDAMANPQAIEHFVAIAASGGSAV